MMVKYEVTGFENVDFTPGAGTHLGVEVVDTTTEDRLEVSCIVEVDAEGEWGLQVDAVYNENGEKLTRYPLGLEFELAKACEDEASCWPLRPE